MEAVKFQTFLKRNKLESKPFQMECFKWCIEKEQQQHMAQQHTAEQQHMAEQQQHKKGGILALEMGLGKTIIMLGVVKCNIKQHTLIVLPRSLLDQWEKNIINFCGCKPLVYHGSRPKAMKMTLEEIKAASRIIVTTYGQISMPSVKQMMKGRKNSLLHEIEWNRIICDEAHHVSHNKTNEFKGAQCLKTEIYWLVTGTPIQNNEKELYNLYSLFGLTSNKVYYNAAENYIETAKKLVFLRTKAAAGLTLPALKEHIINVAWNSPAEEEYAWHIHSLLPFCNVPLKPEAAKMLEECENLSALRMRYLSRAQQVCLYQGGSPLQPPFEEDEEEDTIVHPQGGSPHSKIEAVLQTLLERKANGCGKIVFCHYYKEIDIIAECLLLADPTLRIAKFDGRVKNSQRAEVLSQPVDILLAQIKMCREGLNLQDNYSEVYFPSPHFNPATEQQAIARCWRMGQQKEVQVFRYLLGGHPPAPPIMGSFGSGEADAFGSSTSIPHPSASAQPSMGVQGGCPLTMDMYSTQLHIKKQEFISRLASVKAKLAPKKIKIVFKNKK